MMNRLGCLLALLLIPAAAYAKLPPKVQIAPPNEPGQRLVITGRVFGSDGAPRRVTFDADQADAQGHRYQGFFHRDLRLHGRLLTASDGSYEIDTIKPAPESDRNVPAHIHVRLHAPGVDQNEDIRFEGNSRGLCAAPREADGILHCTVDFHIGSGSR